MKVTMGCCDEVEDLGEAGYMVAKAVEAHRVHITQCQVCQAMRCLFASQLAQVRDDLAQAFLGLWRKAHGQDV